MQKNSPKKILTPIFARKIKGFRKIHKDAIGEKIGVAEFFNSDFENRLRKIYHKWYTFNSFLVYT